MEAGDRAAVDLRADGQRSRRRLGRDRRSLLLELPGRRAGEVGAGEGPVQVPVQPVPAAGLVRARIHDLLGRARVFHGDRRGRDRGRHR